MVWEDESRGEGGGEGLGVVRGAGVVGLWVVLFGMGFRGACVLGSG